MVEGFPDAARFREALSSVVVRARSAVEQGARVVAFGEIVALLWEDGKHHAAIRLEQLWNGLCKEHSFFLHCAYPIKGFSNDHHSEPFLKICSEHSDVIPSDSYTSLDSQADQRRNIALLQQKLPVQIDLRSARSMVAWMLRQALPYPSFIVRDRHIAVRLGLSLGCVRAATASRTPLAKSLNRAVYKGTLAGFGGTRWWSAGIDALAWSLPRQKDARIETLEKLVAPVELEELALVDPVVVSDGDLIETDDIAPAAECVRAADDHFPPHAPPAWVRIEDARRDRVLARRVKLQDQAELAIQP